MSEYDLSALMRDALEACERMRAAQRTYFRTRNPNDLRISKDAEKRADDLIATALRVVRGEPVQEVLL